jgi:hypothetical protein
MSMPISSDAVATRGQPALLERLFDLLPLFQTDAAVMGSGERGAFGSTEY